MNAKQLAAYYANAIARGFPWECPCGELHTEERFANNCRKCRQYLSEKDQREAAIDVRTQRTPQGTLKVGHEGCTVQCEMDNVHWMPLAEEVL